MYYSEKGNRRRENYRTLALNSIDRVSVSQSCCSIRVLIARLGLHAAEYLAEDLIDNPSPVPTIENE